MDIVRQIVYGSTRFREVTITAGNLRYVIADEWCVCVCVPGGGGGGGLQNCITEGKIIFQI